MSRSPSAAYMKAEAALKAMLLKHLNETYAIMAEGRLLSRGEINQRIAELSHLKSQHGGAGVNFGIIVSREVRKLLDLRDTLYRRAG